MRGSSPPPHPLDRHVDEEKPYIKPTAPKGLRVRLGITNHRKLQV